MSSLRISKWLQSKYPLMTGRQRDEVIETKLVTYSSGMRASKGDKINAGEELDCQKLEEHLALLKSGAPIEGVKIVFEGNDYVVIDKPAGVASQPISLFDTNTITHWARWKFPQVNQSFSEPQPTLTPHRLDIGTSGLLIVALNKPQFLWWREQFRHKLVSKEYLAWCWGAPARDNYEVDLPIAHMPADPRKMIPVKEGIKYRPPIFKAHSKVTVQKRDPVKGIFLARVECQTGVTHQVRVHLAALGYPLVGDSLYDPHYSTRSLQREFHALRAYLISSGEWTLNIPTEDFCSEY